MNQEQAEDDQDQRRRQASEACSLAVAGRLILVFHVCPMTCIAYRMRASAPVI